MRNLLLGNGINIQMGGLAYTSKFIMDRVKFKARLEEYGELFEGTLKPEEIVGILDGFVDVANDIRNGLYDGVMKDQDFMDAVQDFKKRYIDEIKEPHDIMLEDWFLLVNAFLERNDDLQDNKKAAIVGFERLILDAIYNDGDINDLYKRIDNKKVLRFFRSYDNIFTLNYDNNIENLTRKNVYHLHGDFSVLADSENEECINGFIRNKKKQIVYQKKYKHCYCNALLNYSGKLKTAKVEEIDKAKDLAERLLDACIKCSDELERLKNLKINDLSAYEFMLTKMENPELQFSSDYHFRDFKNIDGEIDIIGMSPNNDEHIFDMIFDNPQISVIRFYYFSESERNYIEKNYVDSRVECKPVLVLWKGLNWKKPVYNCNFTLPDEMDIIEICREFSAYKADKEEILQSAGSISEKEIRRLCDLVNVDMQKRNPEQKSTDEHDFNIQRFSISYIALKEGILPPALYLLYIKYGVQN